MPSPSKTWVRGMSVGGSFPAGVGPGSPSRDAANWLPSQFGLSVETRRQYGWLRMVYLVCASSELQFGDLREGGGTREAGSTVAESLVVLYQVGTHQIRRRRRAARSLTSQGRAKPMSARTESRTGRFLREKLISDHGHFSSYESHMERRKGKIRGAFSRMHRAFDVWMLARAPASPAQGFHHHGPRYFNFPYFCTMHGLEKLGIVDENWLERICPICC